MKIAHVNGDTIEFEDVDRLNVREIDRRLLYKSEAVPLEGPEGAGKPFVAFVRRGGKGARSSLWSHNVLITQLITSSPDLWLGGPVIVAAYRDDGSLRGLTETEQGQLQIWGGGPGWRYPLLMVADPE